MGRATGKQRPLPREVLPRAVQAPRSEEHTSELQSPCNLVCRLLLEKKKKETRFRNGTPKSTHAAAVPPEGPLKPRLQLSNTSTLVSDAAAKKTDVSTRTDSTMKPS